MKSSECHWYLHGKFYCFYWLQHCVTTDGTTLCVKSRRALSARWTFQAQSPHATGMTQEKPGTMTTITLTRPRQMTTTTENIAATNLLTVACGILADWKKPEIANLCHWKLCCYLDNATSLIANVSWAFSKNNSSKFMDLHPVTYLWTSNMYLELDCHQSLQGLSCFWVPLFVKFFNLWNLLSAKVCVGLRRICLSGKASRITTRKSAKKRIATII